MRRFTLIVTALLMAVVSMAQQKEPRQIELTQEDRLLVENNNNFAFRLFQQAHTQESMILSPLSITYALGMLNNGAAGRTQREINEVLGFGVAGADAINRFCYKLLTESTTLDEETKVMIANTIFLNNHWDYQLKKPFVEKAKQYYNATPEACDFYDGETLDVINKWASDHTEQMIKEVLSRDEFNVDAVSYLLNAIYFKGAWSMKFDLANTKEESFNGGGKVPMMHLPINDLGGGKEFRYTENDLYQAIELPYGNGAYLMTIFLPRKGKTVGDVVQKMDGKSWRLVGHEAIVDLKLPRFETDTDVDLVPIMSALGMPTAFDRGNAEFPEFCNYPVYIALMKQVAKIKVNEEGTEAAAVTVIGVEKAAMPNYAEFHANRPFLYTISEQSSGAIFFIGQYMGDGTSGIGNTTRQTSDEGVKAEKLYNLQGQRLQAPPAKGPYIKGGRKVMR